jgi:hypothetical protein
MTQTKNQIALALAELTAKLEDRNYTQKEVNTIRKRMVTPRVKPVVTVETPEIGEVQELHYCEDCRDYHY